MSHDPSWAVSVKSVEALRRGLEVLQTIEQMSAATLADLHQQTRIPKATLLRMLKTLMACGRVTRSEIESRYLPVTAPGAPDAVAVWQSRLASIAAPVRVRLEQRVPWPTDLAVRDGTTARVGSESGKIALTESQLKTTELNVQLEMRGVEEVEKLLDDTFDEVSRDVKEQAQGVASVSVQLTTDRLMLLDAHVAFVKTALVMLQKKIGFCASELNERIEKRES